MKKILGLMVAVCSSISAGAWGLLPSIGDGTSLLFHYVGQREVTQPVCIRTHVQGNTYMQGLPDKLVSEQRLLDNTQFALNYWVKNVRANIEQAGRQEEFADLLAVLPQKVTVQKTDDCYAKGVLVLNYAPYPELSEIVERDGYKILRHKDHVRSFDTTGKPLADAVTTRDQSFINIYERIDWFGQDVLTHEVGHLYGLADQYGYASFINSETNIHPYFSYLTVIEGSGTFDYLNRFKVASILGEYKYQKPALQKMYPDDVDGFINAVDFVQFYERGKFSARISSGWKSFSLPNVYYAYVMPFQYKGDPADRVVPDELLARMQNFKSVVGGIDVEEIRRMEKIYAQTNAYRKAIEAKQKEVVRKRVEDDKHSLDEFSDAELEQLKNEALYQYYDRRLLAVDTFYAEHLDRLHFFANQYRASKDEYHAQLDRNTAWASRTVDGKRYFPYKKEDMQALFRAEEQLRRDLPDYPDHPDRIDENALRAMSTQYVMNTQAARHCAVCGKELSVDRNEGTMKGIRNRQGRHWFYVCDQHQHFSGGISDLKREYVFRSQKSAAGDNVTITYDMADKTLKSRAPRQEIARGVQAGLAGQTAIALKPITPVPVIAQAGNVSTGPAVRTPSRVAAANVPASVAPNPLKATPTLTPTSASSATVSAQPTKQSTSTAKEAVPEPMLPKGTPASVGMVPHGEKITCEICGKEIPEGTMYYKRTSSKAIHRHNECAYTFFAKHHAVDEEALAKYEAFYFFSVPNDVVTARGDMKALDLNAADIRRFRSQAAAKEEQRQRQLKAAQEQDEARARLQQQLRTDCASYMVVTEADLNQYEQQNARTLRHINQKQAAKEQLSTKEERVQRYYTQLKQNREKTIHCQALEQQAANGGQQPARAQQKRSRSGRTDYLVAVAEMQINGAQNKRDKDGLVEGTYAVLEAYNKGRKEHAYLYTMEQYSKINVRFAAGGQNATTASYLEKMLKNKRDAFNTRFGVYETNQLARALEMDRKAYPAYEQVVAELLRLRDIFAKEALDPDLAQANVALRDLRSTHTSQLYGIINRSVPLGKMINELQGKPAFAHIAQGLAKEPIVAKNGAKLQLNKVWAMYGRYGRKQADGTMLVELGKALVKAEK